MAAPLLLSGSVLLAAALLLLPPASGSWVGWTAAVGLLVHAALVWVLPVRTRAGDLATVSAVVTATAAIAVSAVLVSSALHAWAILLALPVLYAGALFGRAVAAASTALACVSAFLVLTSTDATGVELGVDALLVCGCLVMLAAVVVRGMEHMAALVAELERLAAVDGLTGLVTRRVLDDVLEATLGTARSSAGTALVLVDLDRFKVVNDVHGHLAGDAALQHVGRVLTAAVRSTDAVVGRIGGDELAVLLSGCSARTAGLRAADLVQAVRDSPLVLADGTELQLTISAGMAHAPDHAADVRSLYAGADAALYTVKRAGRDGFAVSGGGPRTA